MESYPVLSNKEEDWEAFADVALDLFSKSLGGTIFFCYGQEEYNILSIKGKLAAVNDPACLRQDTGMPLYLTQLVYIRDRKKFKMMIEDAAEHETDYTLEYRMVDQNGNIIWFRGSGRFFVYQDKRYLVHGCVDITLRGMHGSRITTDMLNTLPCGICCVRIDSDLTILNANDFFYKIYGYPSDTEQRKRIKNVKALIDPSDFPLVYDKIKSNMEQKKETFELEHRGIHYSGKTIWLLARCQPDSGRADTMYCVLLDISGRKEMEETLRIREEENRIAFQDTDRLMDIYDISSRTICHAKKLAWELGVPEKMDHIPYSMIEAQVVAKESEDEYIRFFESMNEGIPEGRCVVRLINKNGICRWYSAKYTLTFVEDKPQKGIISHEDITRMRERELAYEKWTRYFDSKKNNCISYYEYNLTKDLFDGSWLDLFKNLPDSVRSFTGAVKYIAERFVYKEDIPKYYNYYNREKLMMKFYQGQYEDYFEYRRKKEGGGYFWASGTVQLIPDPYTEDVKAFILVENIDEKKNEMSQMKEKIERDGLTGLYNRTTIIAKIDEVLRKDSRMCHGLIMLDIDHFKHLNDNFGHKFGDQVIKDLASILKKGLAEEDLCGRLGGDEFIILLWKVSSETLLKKKMGLLHKALKKEYNHGAKLSVSIGAAQYPKDGSTFEELYEMADLALYEAKDRGRGQYVIYHDKE